jgi:hypothetical protein
MCDLTERVVVVTGAMGNLGYAVIPCPLVLLFNLC